MPSPQRTPVPPGVTPATHKRVTMRNTVVTDTDTGRFEVVNEAVDYVPVDGVAEYAASARTRWQEVIVTEAGVPAPPTYQHPQEA